MIPPIILMIAAQQRANAARKTILDPKIGGSSRGALRTNLLKQEIAAKAEADRLAKIVLEELEQGKRGDLFALGAALVEPEEPDDERE